MDLNHLRYFQAIATSGSITAAAKALHVSQPTLTVAMQNLEERLATTLLLRDRSGIQLTATGEVLLRYAGEVFEVVDRAEQSIRGLEKDDVGSFVVGCHESLGAYFLPPFLSGFFRDHPRIELSLWNGTSAAVQRAILERTVHYGIVVNPHPHPDLVIAELFHDAIDLFVAADAAPPSTMHPQSLRLGIRSEADDDPALAVSKARVRGGPLIFAARVAQSREMLDRLAAEGLLAMRTLACGDFELVKSLTLAGIGVGLLPRRVAAYGQLGNLRRLHASFPSFPDTICLVYRSDAHRTGAAMRLKDALVMHGRALEDSPVTG